MTGLFATALLSGCAAIRGDSYCDLSSPLYFASQNTPDYLQDNDEGFLRDVITHNEIWSKICG
jgi:hypothetical protein